MNLINVLIFLLIALSYTTANVVHRERNEPTGIISSNIQPLTYVREKRTPTGGSKGVQLPGDNLNDPIPADILITFSRAIQSRIIERIDQNVGNGNRDPNIAGPSHGRSAQRAHRSQGNRDDGISFGTLCRLDLRISDLLDRQQNPNVKPNPQLLTVGNLRRIINAMLQIEGSQNPLSPELFEQVLRVFQNDLRLGNSNDFLNTPKFNFNQCSEGSSTASANQQLPPPVDPAASQICNSYNYYSSVPLDLSIRSDYNNPQAARPSVISCSVNRRNCNNNHSPRVPHQNSPQQNQMDTDELNQNPARSSERDPSPQNQKGNNKGNQNPARSSKRNLSQRNQKGNNNGNQNPVRSSRYPSKRNKMANNNGHQSPAAPSTLGSLQVEDEPTAGSSATFSLQPTSGRFGGLTNSQIEVLNREYASDSRTPTLTSKRAARIMSESKVPVDLVVEWFKEQNSRNDN